MTQKRQSEIRVVLTAVALTLGLGGCKQDAGPVSPVDPAKIYDQMCARCHGPDGRGNPDIAKLMPVKDLTSPEVQGKSVEELESVIMKGRDSMPAFGEALTPRKIEALVGHIKRMDGGANP